MTRTADIETRAAAVEMQLDALIAGGGTLSAIDDGLKAARAMIADLRIHYAASDLLASKNIAALGEDEIIAKLMPLVRRKLKETA